VFAQWPVWAILGLGMAVGAGIQRQPGWRSRPLQILASAGAAGGVALVAVVLMRPFLKLRRPCPPLDDIPEDTRERGWPADWDEPPGPTQGPPQSPGPPSPRGPQTPPAGHG
jgi:hypothetical protein